MVVTCENCESKFKLDDSIIKDTGSKVRCSSCQHVFTVFKPTEAEVEEPVPDIEAGEDQAEEAADEELDFDLFDSEQDDNDGLSLEEFGLEGGADAGGASEDGVAAVSEDQITADDLGFGDEYSGDEAPDTQVDELATQEDDGDLGLDDLSLEEDMSTEPDVSMEADDSGAESDDELLFEDLTLEEDSVDLEAAAPEEADDEISFEDLSLEEEISEEVPSEGESLSEAEGEEPALSFEDESLEEVSSSEEFDEGMAMEAGVGAEEDFPDDVPVASLEEGDDFEEEGFDEDIPAPEVIAQASATKKRISLPLMICLIVVLVGGGAYAGFTFLKGSNINIPFLESIAGVSGGDQADSGNLQITLMENLISGGFVENGKAGRLFVIKGKIRSNYPDMRNFIRMKGVLYFRDGKVAQDNIVYCGNILSDAELQTLDRDMIKKRLSNRFGDNKANFKVPAGKVLPFMVVFHDIPQELGEFSVEVVDSMSG